MYTKDDVQNAPFGHVRFKDTAVEVVTYRTGQHDLCILLNINGICAYRATLQGPFRPGLEANPYPPTDPFEDAFVIRALE